MDGDKNLAEEAAISAISEGKTRAPAKKKTKSKPKAQKARPAKKSKPKAATKRKPLKPAKAKTKPAKAKTKPAKKAKAAKKPLKKSKPVKTVRKALVRTHRIDLRLSSGEKAKLKASAKRQRRTITSLLQEWIERLK